MTSHEIRQQFLDFFKSKQHKIVPSAPLVNKDDPTLMFINAGMNPFKDFFLGNKEAKDTRVADTQKCLRVSGKQNDLEEVGIDSYHQTMFEMLGNWSFGDYFKEETIAWAWELLTEVYKIDKSRLYISVFEGDKADGLEKDTEAIKFWKKWVHEDRILLFDKKDNFWEMGETGPCGPCSEIHVDMRSDEDRAKIDGASLVNMDDPEVIEIWNLVFIEFNRKADGSLENLPAKNIDTGMGFERLCMALQGKKSNYDTDIFAPFIKFIEKESSKKYTSNYDLSAKSDIAMRVVADHVRAVAFAIADGQLLSNTGAGYVIRRILRRAVRYYFSFLDIKTPFLHKLVPLLASEFKNVFPELDAQKDFVEKLIKEEERSFLRTLDDGLKRLENIQVKNNILDGKTAFKLYDTYGFPLDLTKLIAEEKGWTVDEAGFQAALKIQKEGSQQDAQKEVGDWTVLKEDKTIEFVGYDELEVEDVYVTKYRTVKLKKKNEYQIVLNKTPFYAEGGGQVGDTGLLFFGTEKVVVLNTKKENDLIIHFVKALPKNIESSVKAVVNAPKRHLTENNHSATHLLHSALRQVLGTHVQQKGSLVKDDALRFDFSHFQKLTEEELATIENIVNTKIRKNIVLGEARNLPLEEAQAAGATMLFGEKYGETVRMITFDENYSRELCGGCHVKATGQIGLFKITSEGAIAAGTRRIEAVTATGAEKFVNKNLATLNAVKDLLKNPKDLAKSVSKLQDENKALQKQIEQLVAAQAAVLKTQLKDSVETINGINLISAKLPLQDAKAIKTLAFQLKDEIENLVVIFGAEVKGKPQLTVCITDTLATTKGLHAGNIVRELAKEIRGGGGGQAFFATAGGSDASGLDKALEKGKTFLNKE